MIQYEGEYQDFIEQTPYPFLYKLPSLENNVIIDITLINKNKLYLSSFLFNINKVVLKFNFSSSLTLFSTTQIKTPIKYKDYPLLNTDAEIIGYIRFGPGIEAFTGKYKEVNFSPESSEVEFTCHQIIDDFNTFDFNIESGYNINFEEENNSTYNYKLFNIVPVKGGGKGQYCGEDLAPNAVYSINGVSPDTLGNLVWNASRFFIIDLDFDNHKINFNLTIDDDRLLCTRTGYKGPTGFIGPIGATGDPGNSPNETEINFKCEQLNPNKIFS